MASHNKLITLLVLSLLLEVALSYNGVVVGKDIHGWDFMPRISVFITNNIDSGLRLYYRCQGNSQQYPSYHELAAGDRSWYKEFRKSFWGRTRYSCTFTFGGQTHRFDIYRDSRDNIKNYQCENCLWSIRRNGPCALNAQTKRFDICYAWDR